MEEDQPRYLMVPDVPAGAESGSARRRLNALDNVDYVPEGGTSWAIAMVQANHTLFGATYDKRNNTGKPICILDSGISGTHPDLKYDIDFKGESCARQQCNPGACGHATRGCSHMHRYLICTAPGTCVRAAGR